MSGLRAAVVTLLAALLSGCGTVSYYWQAAAGHLDLMQRRRPLPDVMADAATTPELRDRLARVMEIRDFASRELALPENGSYRSYADAGRAYVAWNVFAAPELSTKLNTWCFPVAGCVAYRGYFAHADAEAYADGLRREGWDVFVAGVPAYSTLGWFDDPVLSTFIRGSEAELARLLFHELAHQVAYVRDDTAFNESFATAVEQAGMERWMAHRRDDNLRAQFELLQARKAAFIGLIEACRRRLDEAYAGPGDEAARREAKARIIADLLADYGRLKESWGGWAGYDRWFGTAPNNAQIASVAAYSELVPAFRRLLDEKDGDFPAFYAAVRELAALPREQRRAALGGGAPAIAGAIR